MQQKAWKMPIGVRSAADAGDHRVGQPPGPGPGPAGALSTPMTRWKSLTIIGNGCGPPTAADAGNGVLGDRGDPVAERLVHGVLEGAGADCDRDDLRTEHPHPGRVQRLPVGVLLAHVHGAVQAEQRAGCGGGPHRAAGPGLGDHPGFGHPPGQQHLRGAFLMFCEPVCGSGPPRLSSTSHPAAAENRCARVSSARRAASVRSRASSSAWNAGSALAAAYWASSSFRVEMSDSGTNRPP